MIDAKDRDKLSESGDLLYSILSNIEILSSKTPILIVCNKQDLQFARKPIQVESDLEQEIEKIRKVKKVVDDEN